LSENPNFKVLLLEAGGEPNPLTDIPLLALSLSSQNHIDWKFQTEPQSGACLGMKNGVRFTKTCYKKLTLIY